MTEVHVEGSFEDRSRTDDAARRDRDRESYNRGNDTLNPDEREELNRLRAQRDQPKPAGETLKAQAAREAEEEAKKPTHYLLLGNGDVVESQGSASTFHGIPVIHSSVIPEDTSEYDEYKKGNNNEAK